MDNGVRTLDPTQHIFNVEGISEAESLIIPTSYLHKTHLAAVIPAYNESLVIGSVVLQTRKYVDCVIVVDDGSKDTTAEVARLAGAEVIQLERNQGKAIWTKTVCKFATSSQAAREARCRARARLGKLAGRSPSSIGRGRATIH